MPLWPDTLPDPQADGFTVESPPRVEVTEILFGTTRLAVKARTAPMVWSFTLWLTRAQMQTFEEFYRGCVETNDGEFYARWIGGSRVVAFREPYQYAALGSGWALNCTVVRTRIDATSCDDFLSAKFGSIYRAELAAVDRYEADLAAPDVYISDWDPAYIAENEC